MERLYVKTNQGQIPIDNEITEKYDLKEGTYTPFSHQKIVDQFGNFIHEKGEKKHTSIENQDDDVKELENGFMLSTSEMLDIAGGADSFPDENQDD